jgi:type VI secretion system protein ImpI
MDIIFEIVSRQKFSPDVTVNHMFGEVGGIIGRSDECDWILPDKTKQISRKHAIITCYNGSFHIEDISANGIFTSLGHERLPSNTPIAIAHGDGFLIGEYTIMARLMQNPGSYVGGEKIADTKDLFADDSLPLNPLEAMTAEATRDAAARLGNYNDILGQNNTRTIVPSDHSDARIATLPSIKATLDITTPYYYDPWDASGTLQRMAPPNQPEEQKEQPAPDPEPEIIRESVAVPETDIFFQLLGYRVPPESKEERERVLRAAADLLRAAVEGITQAMQNRAECKNELRLPMTTTSLAVSNNPLKFSPTAESALMTLLSPRQKGVMEAVESMKAAFRDNHSHHMGLLAGARAAVGAALNKIAPEAVEARLDANGPVRLGRSQRLWSTFIRMHHTQKNDHEGFTALFYQEFARAYEMQCRTLNPTVHSQQQGDKE